MKLMLAIGSLRAGGAERVMSSLADEFARRGHEVALVTLSDPREDFFKLSPAVRRVSIGLEGASSGLVSAVVQNWRRIIALRRALGAYRPDVAVSFLTTMNVLVSLASRGMPHALLLSERVDPTQHSVGRAWDWMRLHEYRRAAALVVQTESVARWFQDALGSAARPVVVIPNPLAPVALGAVSCARSGDAPYVLGVGRLEEQKGFDILIDAFALACPPGTRPELRIAGTGSLRSTLEQRAYARGVADRVRFIGQSSETAALMRGASAFVLSSRFEGFPNALLEAMACGAPCIAADCPSGPRELLGVDEGGLLVPVGDVERLAAAIRRVLADPELSARLSATGRRMAQAYSLPVVAERWEKLFGQARGV